jgi:hypothetical protein
MTLSSDPFPHREGSIEAWLNLNPSNTNCGGRYSFLVVVSILEGG